jgi:multiple sugar transport system ATP-binding protein
MGRAIVRDPQVFLFDEPLSNLDAKLRVSMRAEIKALHQRLKTTTVYVTHDQIEAMTMADKIVVMNGGVVEQIGAPLELYDRPQNAFVAGFIGSPAMNFFNGTVQNGQFVTEDGLILPLPVSVSVPQGQPAIYGIRPEHLSLSDEGLEFELELLEPTGSEIQIIAKSHGHTVVAVVRERISTKVGDIIRLRPELGSVHLFDRESGRKI